MSTLPLQTGPRYHRRLSLFYHRMLLVSRAAGAGSRGTTPTHPVVYYLGAPRVCVCVCVCGACAHIDYVRMFVHIKHLSLKLQRQTLLITLPVIPVYTIATITPNKLITYQIHTQLSSL